MSQERTSSHVLHVRENSASEMEALFKVVDPHAQDANKSIPFRDRNLPASFFQQPGLNQMGVPKGGPETQGYGDVGPISHMRAHSSPASLQQTLSAAPPPHQHHRQHSCELLDEPLPPGWGMARTPQGQRYFLNHVLQTTTWQDPRKSHSPNSLGSPQQPGSPASGTQTPPGTVVDVSKLPLPPGWERAYTPEGEIYFINHVERTTSWFHPSLPPQQQQRVGMRAHQQAAPALQSQPQLSSPPQQPQMCSPVPSGTTSTPVAVGGVQRGPPSSAEQQRQMKLKQLQMEKEMLMKRQEELNRQELMIRKGVPGAEAVDQATEMTTVADPFLGQTGSNTDHSRQESADSGLGGMGTSYNLPRTPEDFLSNMEEMDIHDGGPKVQGQSDFGSMDIASVGDASDSHNMDSEDLVPSLQEDIISSELLKDVENVLNSNKVDNLLTWL